MAPEGTPAHARGTKARRHGPSDMGRLAWGAWHGRREAGHFRPVTPATTTMADVQRVTREVFGHDRLFPGQEEAVRAVLEGRDVLLVSATGSGKSLTYQVAGVV